MRDEWLIFAEFTYNNSVHSATKQAPFYLNSGKEPRVPLSLINTLKMPLNLQNPMASRDFARLHRHLQAAQDAVKAAKQRMADRHGKTSQPAEYQVGDLVLLSTEHLSLKGYNFPKLTPLFVGPFVVKDIKQNLVHLDVPGAITQTFNVKRVERYYRGGRFHEHNIVLPAPHFQPVDDSIRLNIAKILQQRWSGPKRSINQYLIAFEGYGPEHHSWMDESHLKNFFGSRFTSALKKFKNQLKR